VFHKPGLLIAMGASALLALAQDASDVLTSPDGLVWGGVLAAPLIGGLVAVARQAGLAARWLGMLAVLLGLGGGIAFAVSVPGAVAPSIAQGLMAGCAASGAWSAAHNARNGGT